MKKFSLTFILLITCTLSLFGCSCKNKETISKEEAISVLKESLVTNNVEIITTTETIVNNVKTISTQKDVYYGDKYFHLSESTNLSTKTWYGKVNNVLYAFYYTKNANNEEVKTSSRIENAQLESVQKQPNSIVNSLLNDEGNLPPSYEVTGSKKGRVYTIQITSNLENESNAYTFTIKDAKINKIVKNSNIASDSIITTYDYNYEVEEIQLPTLSEYPLNVNG